MSNKNSPGQRFRDAVASEHPLQVVGAINANHALLAKIEALDDGHPRLVALQEEYLVAKRKYGIATPREGGGP